MSTVRLSWHPYPADGFMSCRLSTTRVSRRWETWLHWENPCGSCSFSTQCMSGYPLLQCWEPELCSPQHPGKNTTPRFSNERHTFDTAPPKASSEFITYRFWARMASWLETVVLYPCGEKRQEWRVRQSLYSGQQAVYKGTSVGHFWFMANTWGIYLKEVAGKLGVHSAGKDGCFYFGVLTWVIWM